MGCQSSSEKKEDDNSQQKSQTAAGNEPVDKEQAKHGVIEEDPHESAPNGTGKYKNSGPKYADGRAIRQEDDGVQIFECFKDGLLFRVVKGETWMFYNDTNEYEMHVIWRFGPDSKISPCGSTAFSRDENNWIVAKLIIYPGETAEFIKGKYNGYKSNMSAKPLSDEYRAKMNAEANRKIQREIEQVRQFVNARAKPEEVLATCVRQQINFVDLDFPPADSSLSRPGVDKRTLPSQAWKRPRDYLPPTDHGRIRAINRIEPNDIDQGQLGDCWFLCAVASLAEFPKKVVDVFKHPVGGEAQKKEAEHGAYRVTINKHGWWHLLIVDDYLPTVGNRPCFAKNIEDPAELWVSLLEKAYAKVHGSYASITGGDALHALQDLTGYPINRFDTEWEDALKSKEKSDELFNDIARYDACDYLINLNTPGQDNSAYMGAVSSGNAKAFEDKYKKAGLGMGHAYSVLKVKRFPNFHGRELRLLQIRNPWGTGIEWTGPWGDDDRRWQENPEIAKACDFIKAADGTFWMEWESVKEYFDGGGVCFMEVNWFDYRARGAFVGGFPNLVLEVHCKAKTTVFLSIAQKDKRGLPESDPDHEYAAMMLSVSRGISETRQQVHLNSSSDADKPSETYTFNFARDLSLLYTFEPSEHPYVVLPRLFESGLTKDYVLGLISEHPVGPDFQVTFKTLEKNSKVFQNYPKFTYTPEVATPFETDYQFNPEVGVPLTRRGLAFTNPS